MGQSEENDIALIREARRGAGQDIDILVDAGQVWDWKTALRRAQAFAESDIFWSFRTSSKSISVSKLF